MNVRSVWARGYAGQGVVVTILDDGLETDHPDLKPNYVSFTFVKFSKFVCLLNGYCRYCFCSVVRTTKGEFRLLPVIPISPKFYIEKRWVIIDEN